jgi:hypothetical protein
MRYALSALVVSLTLNAMLGAQVYYLTRPRSVMERPSVIKVERGRDAHCSMAQG